MSTINTEGNSLSPDTYLEMFDFDTTTIGGTEVLYFTNSAKEIITWQTHTYVPFPFEFKGIEYKADGTALARPTLTVSNVHKTLLNAVIALGDLSGIIVTRWRTFYKFTDAGSEPNIDAHYPIDEYLVTRKILQNPTILQLELASDLDRPGLALPKRQILRDKGFPGVSRVRLRS